MFTHAILQDTFQKIGEKINQPAVCESGFGFFIKQMLIDRDKKRWTALSGDNKGYGLFKSF